MSKFIKPKPILQYQTFSFQIGHLITNKENAKSYNGIMNPLNKKTILGFVIPDFQRGLVWNEDQNINLINSIWTEIPIGTYTVNDTDCQTTSPELYNILLDGQQRLNAIELYLDDKIKFGGCYWSEVDKVNQRFFKSRIFGQLETKSNSIDEVKEYYNLMNFGGVAHKENEKA